MAMVDDRSIESILVQIGEVEWEAAIRERDDALQRLESYRSRLLDALRGRDRERCIAILRTMERIESEITGDDIATSRIGFLSARVLGMSRTCDMLQDEYDALENLDASEHALARMKAVTLDLRDRACRLERDAQTYLADLDPDDPSAGSMIAPSIAALARIAAEAAQVAVDTRMLAEQVPPDHYLRHVADHAFEMAASFRAHVERLLDLAKRM